MEKFLLILGIIIIAFLLIKNLYKAIKYSFSHKSEKSQNEFFSEIMSSFLKIREGMTLFLLSEFENKVTKTQLDEIFSNLISASPIDKENQKISKEIIDRVKNNDFIFSFFIEAMRIKTMLLSKLGKFDEGLKIRNNLEENGFSISEYTTSKEPMNPEDFFQESEKFIKVCKEKYKDSLEDYNRMYEM